MPEVEDGVPATTWNALALARAAESDDEQWAWILEALIVNESEGEALAKALVTGANLDPA